MHDNKEAHSIKTLRKKSALVGVVVGKRPILFACVCLGGLGMGDRFCGCADVTGNCVCSSVGTWLLKLPLFVCQH